MSENTVIKNASQLPKVYLGIHFLPGVAEYAEPGRDPYRIFINEDTIRKMNPTFKGRPVYVHHVDEVNLKDIQTEADGYVVDSFFNAADGKTWVKFIIVSDKGHEAIRNGWRLSNAYVPKSFAPGGLWNGVSYDKEVMDGEYEHLAIVNNPRYDESIILDEEQFKEYNDKKQLELKKLSNSKGEKKSMFSFFKKTKVENELELESMSVTLPRSKVEKTLAKLINDADESEMNADEPMMANGDHHVMVGPDKMTVNELVAKHLEMMKEKNASDEADKAAKGEEKKGDGELVPNDVE